jgi:imidazole glycerol phosphate synthase subunit HisF
MVRTGYAWLQTIRPVREAISVPLRKNGGMSNVRHVVVARAASSVRFAPEEVLTFNDVPAGNLRAALLVRTR